MMSLLMASALHVAKEDDLPTHCRQQGEIKRADMPPAAATDGNHQAAVPVAERYKAIAFSDVVEYVGHANDFLVRVPVQSTLSLRALRFAPAGFRASEGSGSLLQPLTQLTFKIANLVPTGRSPPWKQAQFFPAPKRGIGLDACDPFCLRSRNEPI